MPKKPKSTPHHHHNQHHHQRPATNPPAASDYETDFAVPPPTSHPPIPLRTNDDLNLSVLQRHNSAIIAIESVAPYAVLYHFAPASQTWEKHGVEGTMFLCRLQAPPPSLTRHGRLPSSSSARRAHTNGRSSRKEGGGHEVERYALVILNRRNLENFVAELRTPEDIEVSEEYTILRVRSDEHDGEEEDGGGGGTEEANGGKTSVFGVWVFEEPAPSSTARLREVQAAKMVELAGRAAASRVRALEGDSSEDDEEEDEDEDEEDEEDDEDGEEVGVGVDMRAQERFRDPVGGLQASTAAGLRGVAGHGIGAGVVAGGPAKLDIGELFRLNREMSGGGIGVGTGTGGQQQQQYQQHPLQGQFPMHQHQQHPLQQHQQQQQYQHQHQPPPLAGPPVRADSQVLLAMFQRAEEQMRTGGQQYG